MIFLIQLFNELLLYIVYKAFNQLFAFDLILI